ncbi:MAG: DUF2911 domain-containing protein [Saprospiraceae bacterium]|nr:DUF2911 domain-containing protein [Saprospiraceae bacterium]MCB9318526.1 DUF2911 domain-containing protein [Lewinellaceae bacterium]
MKCILTCLIAALTQFTVAQTQLTVTPDVSPAASVMQQIGLTQIRVDYHRPAVNGRTIWGGLVPYGQVWRGGANENTVINFSTPVKINGKTLDAGSYGLHFLVEEKSVTAIFSSNSTSWGSFSYDPTEDALRVSAALAPVEQPRERLEYQFEDLTPEAVNCAVTWSDKAIVFQIAVDVDETVVASLTEQLRSKPGWTWQGWYEAAGYCLSNNTHLDQGLTWATRSVFIAPNAQNILRKAQLTSRVKGMTGESAVAAEMESIQQDLSRGNVTWKEYSAAANYALRMDQLDQAIRWADAAIDQGGGMNPSMVKVNILTRQGQRMEAENLRSNAIAMGSNQELNTYGYQLLYAGKSVEAIRIFEANVAKNADDPNVWDSLAEGYITNGEKEKAISALKKCLSMNPPANLKTHAEALLQQAESNE